MKKILEDLWFGNLCPSEKKIENKEEYNKIIEEIEENEKILKKSLSPDEIELLDKYVDRLLHANLITEKESFIRGFTLGIKIILSSLHSD